ncbi:MAG: hypothetical protein Q9208_008016 [Pyrenodesmia sp. 3 TL-2023]
MAVRHVEDKEAHVYTAEDDGDRSSGFSDPIGVLVEQKWRGTVQDKSDMEVLGRGQVLRGLIVLNNPTYAFERWHGTLIVWAVAMFSALFNTFGAEVLPIVEVVACTLHFLGLFAVIIPLWIFAPRATPSEALLTFTNGGGWPTTGLSAMIGLLAPVGSLFGFDSVVHMCSYHPSLYVSTILILEAAEEIEDAGRTLPRSIMYSVYLNGAMGFLMAVTMCFCLGDLAAIVETPTGYPFIQVFYNATQSYTATNILVAIFLINLAACCISALATASRQLWSFARDKGVPFSGWFAQVSPTMHVPVRATVASVAVTCLVSLINIGSTTALNAIVSLCIAAGLTSYYIAIGCVVWRRLVGAPLPPRRWSLGRYGLAINIASLCFLTPIGLFAFWPPVTPVAPSTMNWAVVMYGGIIIWSLVYYSVWGRHAYSGPVIVVKRDY